MGAPSHRLTLRIYLVSLAQLAVIVGMVALVARLVLQPPSLETFARSLRAGAETLRAQVGDRAAMQRTLDQLRARQRWKASVYDAEGRVLASNATPALPRLSEHEVARLGLDEQIVHVGHSAERHRPPGKPPLLGVLLTSSPRVYAMFEPPRLDPPIELALIALGCVLLVTGASSIVLARSFAQPLSGLAELATKLGAGDLNARARLSRRDEFGQLANAFDEMADRISNLLRAQQELLANVSHELRTPLARIRVALDLAGETDVVSAQEALSEIAEDLAELERLVTDVLQTARLDLAAGRAGGPAPALHTELIDVSTVITKAADRFRTSHPARRLELHAEAGEQLFDADAVLLRRALDNLLDNAQKYSEPSTAVIVRAERVAEGLQISVQDFGIGIAADDLARVATPFFRTDRSRARRTGGIGLGLSLARRIVEAHGGGLDIESQAGVGTTVRITLPQSPSI